MDRGISVSRRLPKGLIVRVWRQFMRPYRRILFVLLLAMVLASVITVAFAPLTGAMIDTIPEVVLVPGVDCACSSWPIPG